MPNSYRTTHLEMTGDEQSRINDLIPQPANSTAEEGEIVQPDIELEAYARTIGYGNGEGPIKTEALSLGSRNQVSTGSRVINETNATRSCATSGHTPGS